MAINEVLDEAQQWQSMFVTHRWAGNVHWCIASTGLDFGEKMACPDGKAF